MPQLKSLTVAAVQHACTNDYQHNINTTTTAIREAAQRGAQLLVLQELHTNLYFCVDENTDHFDLAEPIPGPSTEHFAALAKELQLVIVISLFERRAAGLYHNTAVVLEQDGSIAGIYRKMHIPDDPGYSEKFYFTPGDLGFTPIDTSVGRLGVLVCWDQWYPEAARLMALAGAEMLIYPTAIGWFPPDEEAEKVRQYDAWQTVQRGHAIANGLPVISCNRIGMEYGNDERKFSAQFWGGSFICGPQGELLAKASHTEAETLLVQLQLDRTETVRRIWPFLRDRRIDAFDELTLRYADNPPWV